MDTLALLVWELGHFLFWLFSGMCVHSCQKTNFLIFGKHLQQQGQIFSLFLQKIELEKWINWFEELLNQYNFIFIVGRISRGLDQSSCVLHAALLFWAVADLLMGSFGDWRPKELGIVRMG
jgi:hypothetical protein